MVITLKTNRKIVDSRRNNILLEVQTHNKVLVNNLSEKLNVSPLTIRRDLQVLEEEGFIERFYGGARSKVNKNLNNNISRKLKITTAIAQFSSQYVEDNDMIFINSSKTVYQMIPYITSNNVTIITNNGHVLSLEQKPNVSIFLTGGEVNQIKKSLTGEFALGILNKVNATKCFLGCSGITKDGITTVIPQEVSINERMLERCVGKVYILADDSKIGREYSFLSGSLDKVDALITNASISEELINIQKKGVKVVQVAI